MTVWLTYGIAGQINPLYLHHLYTQRANQPTAPQIAQDFTGWLPIRAACLCATLGEDRSPRFPAIPLCIHPIVIKLSVFMLISFGAQAHTARLLQLLLLPKRSVSQAAQHAKRIPSSQPQHIKYIHHTIHRQSRS